MPITVNAGTDNEFEVEDELEAGLRVLRERLAEPGQTDAEWFAAQLDNRFGNADHTYYADKPGGKYTRIVRKSYYQRSVHAFVENATGAVFKAAGWVGPAKGVRFASVRDAVARIDEVGQVAQFGGYLYR